MYLLPPTLASFAFLLLVSPVWGAPSTSISDRSLGIPSIRERDPELRGYNWKFCQENPKSADCKVNTGSNPEKVWPKTAHEAAPRVIEARMAAAELYKADLDRTLREKPEICEKHPEYLICRMRIGTVIQKDSRISARNEEIGESTSEVSQISQEKRELLDLCQQHPQYSICNLKHGGAEIPRKTVTSRNEDIEKEFLQEKREERELCKQHPESSFCRMRIGTTVNVPGKKISVRNEDIEKRSKSDSNFCTAFPDNPACKNHEDLPLNKNHRQ